MFPTLGEDPLTSRAVAAEVIAGMEQALLTAEKPAVCEKCHKPMLVGFKPLHNYCRTCDPAHYAEVSDGSTASYYELPAGAKELQDLIAFRDMNAQMGEIFRACYRYGQVAHSPRERDLKKIIFYAQAELDRLAKYGMEKSD